MFDWNKAIVWGAFGGVSFALYSLIAEFFELKGTRIKYEKEKVYAELQSLQQKNGKYLVKILPKQYLYSGSIEWPIGTNDCIFDVYPIPHIFAQFTSKNIKVTNPNIFEASYEYESIYDRPHDCPGILHSLMIGIGGTLAFVAKFFCVLFQPKEQEKNFISGPTYGFLKCSMKLLSSTWMVAQCQISEGKKTILLLGLSKEDILHYYKNSQWSCCVKILLMSSLFIFLYKPLKSEIKRLVNWCNSKKIQVQNPLKLLQVEVEQNLSCIICYNNCRNIVFKKCKHFVVCFPCMNNKQVNNIDKCPLCREEIDDELIEVYDCEKEIGVAQ